MTVPAPHPWRWQHYAELASTQDEAIAAARADAPGHLAILADAQTAGRGSRGRAWQAPTGNLNLSLLLRPAQAAPEPGRWALLAALALHDVLSPYAPGTLMLKWPNDVLLNGAKLAGILIDSAVAPDGFIAWVVLGLGANLQSAPHIEGRRTASLPPPAPTAQEIAAALLTAIAPYQAMKLPQICAAWLARAHPPGTALDVQTPQARFTGSFAGLTPQGELLLHGHPTPISSAEIFLA